MKPNKKPSIQRAFDDGRAAVQHFVENLGSVSPMVPLIFQNFCLLTISKLLLSFPALDPKSKASYRKSLLIRRPCLLLLVLYFFVPLQFHKIFAILLPPLPAFFQAFQDDSVLHFKRKKRTLKCSSKKRERSTKKLSLPFRLKIKHELSARPRKKNKNRSMTTKHGTDLYLRNF